MGGRAYARVGVGGLGWLGEAGQPQAPVASMLVALPPGTHGELRLLSDDVATLPLGQPPARVPRTAPALQETVLQGLPPAPVPSYEPAHAAANPYPATAAAIGAPTRWRGQVIAILRVYPVQVLAAERAAWFHRRLRVEVRFVKDAGSTAAVAVAPAQAAAPSEGVLAPLLQRLLANAETARAWSLAAGSVPPAAGSLPEPQLGEGTARAATLDRRWWKIQVRRLGLYRIACDQLASILGDTDPPLAGLRLYLGGAEGVGGQEAALRQVDLDRNGRCDAGAGDAIEFWGEPGSGRYDAAATYWLTVGPDPGLRIALRPSAAGAAQPAPVWRTLVVEQNRYYRPSVPAAEAGSGAHDHWFWDFLALGSSTFPPVHEFPFTLDAVAPTDVTPLSTPAQVSVTLIGLDGAHRVQVSVNGVTLGDLAWQGRALHIGALSIPPGVLHSGENTLRLALAAAQNADWNVAPSPISALAVSSPVLIDRFALTYRLPQPAQLDLERSPLVFGVEPGSWQLALATSAVGGITLLDIGEPLHPVEIAPCESERCGDTWGISGDQAGVYAATAAGERLAVESIAEDVPSQWRSPANGADYILIAHRSLWAAAQRLAEQRRQQGLRVALVDVQDIYDEFSGGQMDAAAIRSFLMYANASWQGPAPAYVLLLGDGTFDPRGYCTVPGACPELATASGSTLIPPYLAGVDPWLGETATDNRFVALEPGSSLPWLAIGRLPAGDAAEAQAMVDKILAYEAAAPAAGDNEPTHLALVSDNAYALDGTVDPASNFWQASDAALAQAQLMATAGGIQLAAKRLYLNLCDGARFPQCLLPDPPYSPYADPTNLLEGLAAWLADPPTPRPEAASLLVHYVGHGSISGWAGQPVLLQNANVAQLGRAPRLPVVLEMTCYTGYFHFPGLRSLAEAWLAAPQRGAVAVIASSGLGLAEAHATLDFALLAELVGHEPTTVGQALLAAKLAAAAGGLPEDVDTFHLFGDPAMPLRSARPVPVATALPTPTAPTIMFTATPARETSTATPVQAATPIPSATPAPLPTVQTPIPSLTPGPMPDTAPVQYLPWLSADEEP